MLQLNYTSSTNATIVTLSILYRFFFATQQRADSMKRLVGLDRMSQDQAVSNSKSVSCAQPSRDTRSCRFGCVPHCSYRAAVAAALTTTPRPLRTEAAPHRRPSRKSISPRPIPLFRIFSTTTRCLMGSATWWWMRAVHCTPPPLVITPKRR